MKIVSRLVTCPRTGEVYKENKLVPLAECQKVEAARKANDARTCDDAHHEARMIRRHRDVRPSVQKVGWRS